MPEVRKNRNVAVYRASVPKEWLGAIEQYREQHKLSETELIRAALRELIGERALPEKDIRPVGRPSGDAWHGTGG